MSIRVRNRRVAALVASIILVAGACGGHDAARGADGSAAPVDGSGDWAAYPSGPLCSAVPTTGDGSFEGMSDDPAATAASHNPTLSTLSATVEQAGLVDTLNGSGPFTIFAPVNDAFAAVPDLDALLADQDALKNVLTFHVVAGERLSSTDLLERDSVQTVQGTTLTLGTEDGVLRVDGQANVGCADVHTANATVHLIDAVLMPTDG